MLEDESIVVRVVFVGHGDFNLLKYAEQIVGLEELTLNVLKYGEDQLIKELPLVEEELIEKRGGHL